MFNKLKKRLFWNLISLCPKFVREKIIRSRFQINYNLDSDLIFKQATTKDEIEQAFNLVYDSYLNLNYIDKNPDQLHLPKYLALPTTAILVIKLKEEVVGTMSIVMDSSLGLPTETTWDISEFKKNGLNIAEISALSIKNKMMHYKGQLLLPLVKLNYLFSRDILNIDGFVIATTCEIVPFYTDLLLYKKLPGIRGRKYDLVKGVKAACCFLKLDDSTYKNYYKVYGAKDKGHNLHHYFYDYESPNIQLPAKMISVQAQLKEKNLIILELLKEKPQLFERFSDKDKLIISNLEPNGQLASLCLGLVSDRRHPRLATMIQGRIEKNESNISMPMKIADVSERGLKIKLLNFDVKLNINDVILIKIAKHLSASTFLAKVIWEEKDIFYGCVIQEKSEHIWRSFYKTLWGELQVINEIRNENKKVS